MKLRLLIAAVLAVSLTLVAVNASSIIDTFWIVASSVTVDVVFWVSIALAVTFQLLGHVIRSAKVTTLFSPIEQSKVSTQLRAFSIGQLFNNLLPLRIGEFIRTAVISQKLNISYLYTFTLVVFERSIDAIIISIAGIVTLLLVYGNQADVTVAYGLFVALGILGVLALGVILLFAFTPRVMLRLIYHVTAIFNQGLKDSLRFKLWSLSYGLSKTLTRKVLPRYFAATIVMWFAYIASLICISLTLIDGNSLQAVASAIAPYAAISTPAGPAGLGVFSSSLTSILGGIEMQKVLVYGIVAWFIMIVPISVIGVISISKTREPLWRRRYKGASDASLANKLVRNEDVSGELAHFLDGYFKGNKPSVIVNGLERRGAFHLVKYFRGGSDAITILSLQGKERVVKKIIPIELKDRLKAQYDWLRRYRGGAIVDAFNEETGADYYSIDIAYDKTSVSLFEYVHEIPLDRARLLLAEAWQGLDGAVYVKKGKLQANPEAIMTYIDKHVYDCLDKAMLVDADIRRVVKKKKILINGVEYDNLDQIIKKIKGHAEAWKDITTWRPTGAVHGDMILDNLLYSRKHDRVIIIDPAPDGNIVEGPVFDFAKAAQSLYCGYEFLLRDETEVGYGSNGITFNEGKSLRFSELDEYMRSELAPAYLTPGEIRAILFHAGVLFIRRLKHQVHYTPENALKFYAVGVRTLNQFLAQYDDRR